MKKRPLQQQLQLELDAAESRRRLHLLARSVVSVLQIPSDDTALVPVLTNQTHCRSNEEAVRAWITRHLKAETGLTTNDGMDSPVSAEVLDDIDFDTLVAALQAHLWERLPYLT